MYKVYIRQFIEKYGEIKYFTQQNIDAYFADLESEDKKKDKGHRESKSRKQLRKVALKFYLNDCLGLKINFK